MIENGIMIRNMSGDNRWLQMYAPSEVVVNMTPYPSVGSAYKEHRDDLYLLSEPFPHEKLIKNSVKKQIDKNNFEQRRLALLEELLRQKYRQKDFRERLIKTKDDYLEYSNNMFETFLGVCNKTKKGQNHLGKITMKIRDEMIEK